MKRIVSLITAIMLVFTYAVVLAENSADNSNTLDMTVLIADNYNADSYTVIDDIISIKSAPENITAEGIKISKNNGVRIKIAPIANDTITITLTGSAVMPDREDRKSGDENVISDTPIAVSAGTTYYLQGSSSTAATVTAIKYSVNNDVEPSETQNPQESSSPAPSPTQSTKPTQTEEPSSTPIVTESPKPTVAPDMSFDNSWNLTELTSDNYNKDEYIAIDDVVSVKSASEYITSEGIKLTKGNGVRIKILPKSDGQIMISSTNSVVMPNYEDRKGGEASISTNELIDVYAGVEYYIQGTSSTPSAVTSVHFKEKEFQLFSVTGIGFNEDYTKILEFDVEKGDDYEHDMVACLCVYDSSGALKSVGIRKILSNSLNIGTNTIKCDIDISGYDEENDTVKIFLWSGLD